MNVSLKTAAKLLLKGYVVGIETDTVYGLAALPEYEYKLYKLKGRNKNKKIVLMINDHIKSDDLKFNKLQYNSWPGKVTLIKDLISYRYCSEPNVNKLIELVGSPLKITSANYSNHPTVTSELEFNNTFKKIAIVKPVHKKSKNPTPSTILLYNNSTYVKILR